MTTNTNTSDFLDWVRKQKVIADISKRQEYEESDMTENEVKNKMLENQTFWDSYIKQQEQNAKEREQYEKENIAKGLNENCNRELTALCTNSKLKGLTFYKLLPFIPVNQQEFRIGKYKNERVDIGKIIRPMRGETLKINNPILGTEEVELNEYALSGCYDDRELDLYGNRLPVNLAFNLRKHVLTALEVETALKLQDEDEIPEENIKALSDEEKFNNPDVNPLKLLQDIAEKMEEKTDLNSNVNIVLSQSIWNALKENPNIQERFGSGSEFTAEALKEYLNLSGDILISKIKYNNKYIWQNLFFCISPDDSIIQPENNGIGNIFIHENFPQVLEYTINGGKSINLEYMTQCKIQVRDREKGFLIKNCI